MTGLKLYTTEADYEDAVTRVEGRGKTVTVPRDLWTKLVLDHGELAAYATRGGSNTIGVKKL